MIIDITQAYAISAGGIFVVLLLINLRPYMEALLKLIYQVASQHLAYRQLIRHNRYFGAWTPADVLFQMFYVTVNVFCLSFKAPSIHMAGLRAAKLSLINMVPAFTGPHLSVLADSFGVSLNTYRRIHRSFGMMSLPLLIFHSSTVLASRISFSLHVRENMWGLIVSAPFPHRSLIWIRAANCA